MPKFCLTLALVALLSPWNLATAKNAEMRFAKRAVSTSKAEGEIAVNTVYQESIEAYGTNYYSFQVPADGEYRISIKGAMTDMSAYIYDEDGNFDFDCDDNTSPADESCVVSLVANTPYFLDVDEWDERAANFELSLFQVQ